MKPKQVLPLVLGALAAEQDNPDSPWANGFPAENPTHRGVPSSGRPSRNDHPRNWKHGKRSFAARRKRR